MKRTNSQYGLTQRPENLPNPCDVESVKSIANKSSHMSTSSLNGAKSTDLEALTTRSQKYDLSKKNYESTYFKLSNLIQESYLEIKHQTKENNPDCMLMLKKSVPFDEEDEVTLQKDPILLFQYIRQIFDKNLELKNEAEKQLEEKAEESGNEYEAQLQKLEAEVRQHIRIEQQLKLYVESTQAKLDDFKDTEPSQVEDMKKEIEKLRSENKAINEKLKKRSNDIENYVKDLSHKSDIIKKLEQQIEAIPILKNKVREMETMLSLETVRTSEPTTLRSYNHNRTSKEVDSFVKGIPTGQNRESIDGKSRKNSQPVLGISSQDLMKRRSSDKEKDKNKENYDLLKMELAKYNGDIQKLQLESYRLNSDHNRNEKSASKYDQYGSKTSRRLDKSGELKPAGSKKSMRSESSSNLMREKEKSRVTEHDLYTEERITNIRASARPSSGDIIEQSRYVSDRIAGSFIQDSHKKSAEKRRGSTSKSRPEYRESAELVNMSHSRHHKIPKTSRPSTGYERQSYGGHDQSRIRKETEVYVDLSKLRSSPGKMSGDRSQSVDTKAKFYRELKSSRGDQTERILEEKRRRSAYNIQSKQHTTFNSTRVSGIY